MLLLKGHSRTGTLVQFPTRAPRRTGPIIRRNISVRTGNVAATLLILRATQALISAHGKTQPLRSLSACTLLRTSQRRWSASRRGRSATGAPRARDRRGALLFCAADLGFAIGGLPPPAVGFIRAGIAIGRVETAHYAAVASLAPPNLRGSAFGVLAAAQSFGNFASSAIAGLLWTVVSPIAALYLALCMLIGAGVTIWAKKRES